MFSARNVKFETKLQLLTGISVLGLLMLGVVSYTSLSAVKVGGPISTEITKNYQLEAAVDPPSLNLVEARLLIYQILGETNHDLLQQRAAQFRELKNGYYQAYEHWSNQLPEGKLRDLVVVQAHEAALDFFRTAEQEFLPFAMQSDKKKASQLMGRLNAAATLQIRLMADADKLRANLLQKLEAQGQNRVRISLLFMTLVCAVGTVIVVVLGTLIRRSILQPLTRTMRVLQSLAAGDLSQKIEIYCADEVGEKGRARSTRQSTACRTQSMPLRPVLSTWPAPARRFPPPPLSKREARNGKKIKRLRWRLQCRRFPLPYCRFPRIPAGPLRRLTKRPRPRTRAEPW
jgi:methyl-accepting chemotaxis protein